MKRSGFTLVELSIVLVIIGLLIGGILAAQSMIETTKINAQVKQLQQIDILVANFQTRYNCLPGDCEKLTNPGNGDGRITDHNGVDDAYSTEIARFWNHMYLGGMVSVNYAINLPSPSVFGQLVPPGYGFPATELSKKAGIVAIHPIDDNSRAYNQSGDVNGNIWVLGEQQWRSGNDTNTAVSFPVKDVLALDKKIDDGVHFSGNIRTLLPADSITRVPAASNDCTTAATSGSYKIDSTLEKACVIGVKMLSQTGMKN